MNVCWAARPCAVGIGRGDPDQTSLGTSARIHEFVILTAPKHMVLLPVNDVEHVHKASRHFNDRSRLL